MKNIKFIDRRKELKSIEEKKNTRFFLVLKGRRRIGKTLLLKKAFPEAIYIFIWPDKSIDWIISQICATYNLPLFKNFGDILTYLLDKGRIVVIDEFQNLLNVDKSVYGEIQKIIDDRKLGGREMKIAVAGSSYSLMNKVFNDVASPLYGRRTEEIMVDNLPIKDLFNEINFSLEEFIKIWAVFEGVPYYYDLLDKKLSAEENIISLILSKDAKLQDEGKVLMSVEFGKDSKTYNTVLAGICEGKTKLSELAGLFDNKKNEVVKYLDILRKEFRLVRKVTPITTDPNKSKEGRYEVGDNFLSFWFYFIDRHRSFIEQERFSELERFFIKNFNSFLGKKFEKMILLLMKDKILIPEFEFTKIGSQWGKFMGIEGNNTYEIDLAALDEKGKKILLGECKWKDEVDAEKIAKELEGKSKYVFWENNKREEIFAIFAKSFSRRIQEFEGKKVYCFDLKDLEKILK